MIAWCCPLSDIEHTAILKMEDRDHSHNGDSKNGENSVCNSESNSLILSGRSSAVPWPTDGINLDCLEDFELLAERPRGRVTRATSKQLRMLKFVNPGRFMEDFDPDRSSREMRKVNRRIYRETKRKNQYYDHRGLLLTDSSNPEHKLVNDTGELCDCLDAQCPGCHFPCPKCGSCRCGAECQCNRRWYYQEVEVEGGSHKLILELAAPL